MFKIKNLEASVFQFIHAEEHENKMRFKGVLVRLDEPSTKPPNGSQGHRILIPKSVAEAKLSTLIGQGVNYRSDLEGHAPQRKVGVITKAWISGKDLMVSGHIWKKDFPEAIKDLKQKNLGMSFEAGEIEVEDIHADIWKLTSLCFTGATILYKDAAAYYKTQAIAAAKTAEQIKNKNGGTSMSEKKKAAAKKSHREKVSLTEAMLQLVASNNKQTKAIGAMCASFEELRTDVVASRVNNLSTAASTSASASASADLEAGADSSSASASASADIAAAKKKKSDSGSGSASNSGSTSNSASDDFDAEGNDTGSLKNLEDDAADEEDEPGHLNDKATNKGRKTTVEGPAGGKSVSSAALAKISARIDKVAASNKKLAKENKKLSKQLAKKDAAIKAAAENTDRRSHRVTDAMTRNLLTKNNVDIDALQASGVKMKIEEMDAILETANLSNHQRVAVKHNAIRAGILEEGLVHSV